MEAADPLEDNAVGGGKVEVGDDVSAGDDGASADQDADLALPRPSPSLQAEKMEEETTRPLGPSILLDSSSPRRGVQDDGRGGAPREGEKKEERMRGRRTRGGGGAGRR
eukprot:4279736-Pyramimonas_sp.AAC.1